MISEKKPVSECPVCKSNWLISTYNFKANGGMYMIHCVKCKNELSPTEYEMKGSKCSDRFCDEIGSVREGLDTLFSSDLSPYCDKHYESAKQSLERKCGICGSPIKSCCC